MWKLTPWAKTRAPVTGVEWRDYEDAEFAELETRFEAGALRPYFHREEAKVNPEPPAARRQRRPRR